MSSPRQPGRTASSCLSALLAQDAGRPRLTSVRADERLDLSAATLTNWVAKTAHLMRDELLLQPGDLVGLSLPRHWLAAVWLLAADASGVTVAVLAPGTDALTGRGGPLSAALVGPDEAEAAAAWCAATGGEALVASLLPFARPWPDPLPTPVRDLAEAVRPHDDRPDAVEPDDSLALFQTDTGPISRRQALEAAVAHAADREWASSCRVLSEGPLDESALIEGLLAPWAVGGSAVWVGNPIATSVVSVVEQERVTDRA